MKKNSTVTIIICGLAALLSTVLFYLLAFDNIFAIPMRWLSLTSLLLVEIIGTIKALTVSKSIFGVTQIITSAFHLAITLVLSIIYVNLFPFFIKQYILISLLLIIIVAVIDILLLYFNNKAQAHRQLYTTSSSIIDMCLAKVRKLLTESKASEFHDQIETIVESLTYTNRAVVGMDDSEILVKIEKLDKAISENQKEVIYELISQIQNLLRIRVNTVKKTGQF